MTASARSPQMLGSVDDESAHPNIHWGWKSDIARQFGVSRSNVNHVYTGRYKSARIARAIAETLGKKHSELWPGAYPEAEFLEAMAEHSKCTQSTGTQP